VGKRDPRVSPIKLRGEDPVKPGDLVQKKFHEDGRIYPYWGSKSTGIPDPIDYMIDGECGIVVESLEPQVWKLSKELQDTNPSRNRGNHIRSTQIPHRGCLKHTPPPIGSLVQYQFGSSKIFGIITSVQPPPAFQNFYPKPALFSIEIMETGGRKSLWDIHELDLLTDKITIIQ